MMHGNDRVKWLEVLCNEALVARALGGVVYLKDDGEASLVWYGMVW